MSRRSRRQGKMLSRFHMITCAAAVAAMLAITPQALAQSDDGDLELRVQRLENQLRQLPGQNEEMQNRNRQLEERLRQLGGGAAAVAPVGQPPVGQPSVVAAPAAQPGYRPVPPGHTPGQPDPQ